MPDDLYDRDILIWEESRADLLRRAARGEKVKGLDWERVAEEIEDVGLSQLNAVQGDLDLILVHLLKVHGWPDSPARTHWRMEIASFQKNAARRFAPSMRQRIDPSRLYDDAVEEFEGAEFDGLPPRPWPVACPFTLDQLLNDRRAALEERLLAAAAGDP